MKRTKLSGVRRFTNEPILTSSYGGPTRLLIVELILEEDGEDLIEMILKSLMNERKHSANIVLAKLGVN